MIDITDPRSSIINDNTSKAFRASNYIHIGYAFSLNTRKGFRIIYLLMRLTGFSFARIVTDIIKVRHKDIDNAIKILSSIEAENQDVLKALTDAYYVYP